MLSFKDFFIVEAGRPKELDKYKTSAEDKSPTKEFRKPKHSVETRSDQTPVYIDPSVVKVSSSVVGMTNDATKGLPIKGSIEDFTKAKVSQWLGDALRYFYNTSKDHPDTSSPLNWDVTAVRVGLFGRRLAYACTFQDEERGQGWLVVFSGDKIEKSISKVSPPIFVPVETKYFVIDNFPLEDVANSPEKAAEIAKQMTQSRVEDKMKGKRAASVLSKITRNPGT